MKSKSATLVSPTLSAEEAEAKRIVEEALVELKQLNRETREIQRESEIIGQRVDAKIARLKERMGL